MFDTIFLIFPGGSGMKKSGKKWDWIIYPAQSLKQGSPSFVKALYRTCISCNSLGNGNHLVSNQVIDKHDFHF